MPAEAISPDGRWVALHRQSGSVDSDLYLADLTQGGESRLPPHVGMVRHLRLHAGFSARILGSDGAGEFGRAYRYTLADDAALRRADTERPFNANARTEMAVTGMTTGAPIAPKGVPTGDISDLGFRQDEGRIVFTIFSSTSPTDVFIADLATGGTRRLTHALNLVIKVDDLVEAVSVHFQGEGGVTIPANLHTSQEHLVRRRRVRDGVSLRGRRGR